LAIGGKTQTAAERGPLRRILGAPAGVGLIAGAAVFLALAALRLAGVLQPMELAAYDDMVSARSALGEPERRVVQIGVTEGDIERFHWPLSDEVLARSIEALNKAGVRVIGIDIFRSRPVAPELDSLLRSTKDVIWATRSAEQGWSGMAAPEPLQGTAQVGFSDLVPDQGTVVRRGLLFQDSGGAVETSLSARLAFAYLLAQGIRPAADAANDLRLGSVTLPPLGPDAGAYVRSDAGGYQILLEFRHGKTIPTVSLSDLLDGKAPAAMLANRLVVFGVTADSVQDFVTTPLDAAFGARGSTYGVTVHGIAAGQLLAHALDGLRPTSALDPRLELAIIAALTLAGGLLGSLIRAPFLLAAAVAAGLVAILGLTFGAFVLSWWLPGAPAGIGLVAAAALGTSLMMRRERVERATLMRLFSAHVSPKVAQELWRRRDEFVLSGRPVPTRLSATAFFSDITGFTTISERLDAAQLEYWLNIYMDAMVTVLNARGAVIERFAGDGIVAVFGVPIARTTREELEADARSALLCALEMCERVEQVNQRYGDESLPAVRIGIGIHSGTLVASSIGNAERLQYSITGDAANVAARLVDVAKERLREEERENCIIAVGETTEALVCGRFEMSDLGEIALRGKMQPVRCFRLVGPAATGEPGRER
jgi:adenylate cyclase